MRCWCGYPSGAMCRLFACGPANATASQNPSFLASFKSRLVLLFWYRGLPRLSWKKSPLNACSGGIFPKFYYIVLCVNPAFRCHTQQSKSLLRDFRRKPHKVAHCTLLRGNRDPHPHVGLILGSWGLSRIFFWHFTSQQESVLSPNAAPRSVQRFAQMDLKCLSFKQMINNNKQ